jgi:hypothetical protein
VHIEVSIPVAHCKSHQPSCFDISSAQLFILPFLAKLDKRYFLIVQSKQLQAMSEEEHLQSSSMNSLNLLFTRRRKSEVASWHLDTFRISQPKVDLSTWGTIADLAGELHCDGVFEGSEDGAVECFSSLEVADEESGVVDWHFDVCCLSCLFLEK